MKSLVQHEAQQQKTEVFGTAKNDFFCFKVELHHAGIICALKICKPVNRGVCSLFQRHLVISSCHATIIYDDE